MTTKLLNETSPIRAHKTATKSIYRRIFVGQLPILTPRPFQLQKTYFYNLPVINQKNSVEFEVTILFFILFFFSMTG